MEKVLLKRTKKRIEMLKKEYIMAYSKKDKGIDILLGMYHKSIDKMKKDIIANDPKISNGNFNVGAKLNLYKEYEEILSTHSIEALNEKLEKSKDKTMDPGFLFALKAELTIRNYFEGASGIPLDNFEEQYLELNKHLDKRLHDEGKEPNASKESDPKKEIRTMYKQLNKSVQKEELRGQIKEQLVEYFADQSKKQKSFYDVSASKTFTKWGITDMTDKFMEKLGKAEINLETIKTKVLEDRKKELKQELKEGFEKQKKTSKNSSQSKFRPTIGPIKEANLKELTFLREELQVRKQLKKAEKHFGIKWKKIFGEETPQVKREFCNLLRSDDSLVKAVKIVQQHFPSTYEPEKTKIVQQSLAAQIEKASANSEKNKPEEKAANLKVNPQNIVSETLIQRNEHLENLDNQTDRMMGGAQAFSEATKKLQQSNRKGLHRIRQLIKPRKQATPVTRTDEQNQEDTLSRKFSQQSEVSSIRSNSITSSIQAAQASTTQKENKGINFPRFQQANWNNWMMRLPALRQLVKPMPMTAATKVDKHNQADTLSRNLGQQIAAGIKRSDSQNASFQRRQPSTVSREGH